MFLLFLPVVVVVALVVAAVALLTSTGAWPLLLIALGLWLLTRQGDRGLRTYPETPGWRRRGPGRAQACGRPSPVGAASESRPRQAPAQSKADSGPQLPADLQASADRIRQKVDGLLTQADRFPPYSPDLYLVRQTGSDYLPATVRAYLSLPAGAAERVLDGSGKTAHQELGEQLGLLEAKLDDVAAHLHARDLDPLLANRRFLEDRLSNEGEGTPPESSAAA